MKKILSIIAITIVFFVIYFLQINLFNWFNIYGISPNLFIIFILFIGLFIGKKIGFAFTGSFCTFKRVLEELKKIRDSGVSILLITHDLGIVAQMADYVYVMSNGEVEESGNVYDIFNAPEGDYTKELINATHEKLEAV